MLPDRHDSNLEKLLDVAAAATAVGTLTKMLPSIAAVFTIVWTGIRIWETPTVQRLFGRSKKRDES